MLWVGRLQSVLAFEIHVKVYVPVIIIVFTIVMQLNLAAFAKKNYFFLVQVS